MHHETSKGIAHIGLIVTLVLVVAAVASAGWYVWQKNKGSRVPDSQNISTPTNQPQERIDQEQKAEEPTYTYPADKWDEYKNEILGFVFKYPKDWGEMHVSHDGSDGFFLAHFNRPTGAWGPHNGVYQQASIELRGHSANVSGFTTHGEFAKGFYERDGKYFKVGDEHGDTELQDSNVLFAYDKGGIPTLLIKRLNYGGYEGLELLANIKDREVVGLNLRMLHPTEIDEYENPAFSQSDIETMKQVAASFRMH